jgi:CBS domain-containing protein
MLEIIIFSRLKNELLSTQLLKGVHVMKFVRDILKNKKDVWTINAKDTIFNALVVLKEKDIGALIVIDDNSKVVGIISERDYARKLSLEGKSSKETSVEEIMTPLNNLYTISPDNSIDECMVIVTGKHVRHLPVFDGKNLVGIISIGDIVKEKISEQEFLIEQLSNYITGKYPT